MQVNESSTLSAHVKCIPVEENTHCVITAGEKVGNNEMLDAGDGDVLH